MILVCIKKIFTERLCEKIISFHSDWAEDNGYIDVKKNDPNIRDCKIYKPLPIEPEITVCFASFSTVSSTTYDTGELILWYFPAKFKNP